MAFPQHLVPLDALTELCRARAKVGNKSEELECLSLLEKEGSIDGVYKSVLSSLLAVDTNVVVPQRKKAVALRKRKRKDSSVGKRDDHGKARISEKNKVGKGTRVVRRRNKVKKEKQCEKSGPGSKRVKIEKEAVGVGNSRLHHKNTEEINVLIQYQSENVARAQSDEMCREQIGGIFQGVVKEEDEADVEPVVEKELGEEVVRGDYGLASKAIKMEPDHFVESRSPIEGKYSKTRNVKCPKCSMTFENRDENHVEGVGRSSTIPEPEVVILDSDMIVKKGIPSPFISARMLHRSVCFFSTQKSHPFSLSLCFCFSCSSIESSTLTDG